MAGYEAVAGQEHIKEHFRKAVRTGIISHSYILSGEADMGKLRLAKTFAAAQLCEDRENAPCGCCHSCRMAEADSHPDIIVLNPAKPKKIVVDDIRTQINDSVLIKPYYSQRKVYIIPDADKMNANAQNALLKTLEEPPECVSILLLSSNTGALLPTILSRCIMFNMKPADDETIRTILREKYNLEGSKADVCVAFARGNVKKAEKLAANEDFEQFRSNVISLIHELDGLSIDEIISRVRYIKEYRLEIEDYLDFIAIWFRDVLIFKATGDPNQLILRDEVSGISKDASRMDYEGLEEIIEALDKAKQRLKASVSSDLVLQLLLMTISDNKN